MKILLRSVGVLGLVAVLLFLFVSWTYSGVLMRVDTPAKVVALTYDDGPNPPDTQALLALLAQRDVRATFFLKGRNVEAFPALAATVAAGHEIANHSYHHNAMAGFGRADMQAELERVNTIIEDATGIRPILFRPPYGVQGAGLKRALDALGMRSIGADASGNDWQETDARVIADRVLTDVGPGSIVVLHDGHADVEDPQAQDSRAPTVAATALVIDGLRAAGYRFVTVSELLALAAP